MAGHRFRLESLLKLRLSERDLRRADVAEVQQAIEIVVQQIDDLEAEARAMTEARREAGKAGAITVDRLISQDRFCATIKLQVQDGKDQLRKLEEEAERRRQALQAADHAVRVLEKLKEKQQAEFQKKDLKRIQEEMDEIAGRRASGLATVRSGGLER
jgi:flagellar export protein FliJ